MCMVSFWIKYLWQQTELALGWRDAVPKGHQLQTRERTTTISNTATATGTHQQAVCV